MSFPIFIFVSVSMSLLYHIVKELSAGREALKEFSFLPHSKNRRIIFPAVNSS
ncbi:hypothetical protein TPE_0562 [Treponema pedis str. T A4]|uniref:Uncharacterized protein n=1 Tax=Treponema pedis str. T A4 TaxID=1291379 RepID=S5ZYE6_9SPIR|nr:hypothetical protein TPE_0562 [Treponema pedis str. T A4]